MGNEQPVAPPSRPLRKRDFKDRLIQSLLEHSWAMGQLLELIDLELATRLDFEAAVRLDRRFHFRGLTRSEVDVLYRVPWRANPAADGAASGDVWVLLHVEHQSRPDSEIALRYLAIMVELWKDQLREHRKRKTPPAERSLDVILPILLYTGDRPWKDPASLEALVAAPPELAWAVPKLQTLVFNLNAWSPQRLASARTAVGIALRVFRDESAVFARFREVFHSALDALGEIDSRRSEEMEALVHLLYHFVLHGRPDREYDELIPALASATETIRVDSHERFSEMFKTRADVLLERGIELGKSQGIELGSSRTLRRNILQLVLIRFDRIPRSLEARLDELGSDALARLFDDAAAAPNLADFLSRAGLTE